MPSSYPRSIQSLAVPIRGLISNGEAINRIEKVMGSLEHQRMVSKQSADYPRGLWTPAISEAGFTPALLSSGGIGMRLLSNLV